jgi:hypothetical protein
MLFVFRLRLSIHNIQIIQNSSLLFVFDLNYFNNLEHIMIHSLQSCIKLVLYKIFLGKGFQML